MNTRLVVLLGSVGAVHLVAGGLFLAGGCAQEDPPMPPGIYVPQQDSAQAQTTTPAPAQTVTEEPITEMPPPPQEKPAKQPKPVPVSPAKNAGGSGHGDRLYVVVKNDSLWKLAHKNGLTIEELASYNNLPANARLKVGQKLYIPAAGKKAVRSKASGKKAATGKKTVKPAGKSASSKGKKSAAKSAPSKGKNLPADGIYVIKSGDNFSTIAKKHGLKVSDIMAANPGVDSSRLKIGQQIRLTAGAAPVKSAAKPKKSPAVQQKASEPAAEPNSESAAPAKEVNKNETDNLLNSVDDPKSDVKTDEAVNAVMNDPNNPMSVLPDKDKVVSLQGGKGMEATLGEATTLEAFCRKYHATESEVRKLNPDLPADGQLKAGTKIKLLGEEDSI